MLTISEIITLAGIERKESRGGHFHEDYQAKSDEWAKYNLRVRKGAGGEVVVERIPVKPLNDEQKLCIEEQK